MRGLDGDAVANLPAESLGRARADDRALAVLQEGVPLVVGNDQLREYLALVFRVDHELGKEVLFVLVDAAEPVVVRHALRRRECAESCRDKREEWAG